MGMLVHLTFERLLDIIYCNEVRYEKMEKMD